MQILIIGKSHAAKKLSNLLAENKENIVFGFSNDTNANFVNINLNNIEEIKEFALANEIGLSIVVDYSCFDRGFYESFSESNLNILCPDINSAKICTNKSTGKKFAYKNKIQTNKFAIFEKMQQAIEYLNTTNYPVIIKPDKENENHGAFIAETYSKAKKQIETLFQTGNKKIIFEDFIFGKEYNIYVLTDGINVLNLLETVSYFDDISTNNVSFIKEETKLKIKNEIIPNILNALMEEGAEYQGILGISFVIYKDEIYLVDFKPFIDNLDIENAINTVEDKFETIFFDCATGALADNFKKIKSNDLYSISAREKDEIISTTAKTFNKAVDLLIIEGKEEKEIAEARKIWAN